MVLLKDQLKVGMELFKEQEVYLKTQFMVHLDLHLAFLDHFQKDY